jgi:hypothetical protein
VTKVSRIVYLGCMIPELTAVSLITLQFSPLCRLFKILCSLNGKLIVNTRWNSVHFEKLIIVQIFNTSHYGNGSSLQCPQERTLIPNLSWLKPAHRLASYFLVICFNNISFTSLGFQMERFFHISVPNFCYTSYLHAYCMIIDLFPLDVTILPIFGEA